MMHLHGARLWQYLFLLPVIALSFKSNAAQDGTIATNNAALTSIGRKIYRDGLLPDGKPLTAIVAGDVAVLGTQFSCENCHGRSGMGAAEGDIIVPPIAGSILYTPRPQPSRPAYTYKTLVHALREGIDPKGRKLDSLMPHFKLSDKEIKALATYLQGLSSETSPGVDANAIHFATVVSDTEDKKVRDAVLNVLQTFVNVKNRQTRLESQRPDRGYSPASRLRPVFRKWVLDVWTVKGPSDTWRAQLEKYYKRSPAFVLLGGLVPGSWKPMGQFCEAHEIPCLFPSTNLPYIKKDEFYSVHFSQGLFLEAKMIAKHIQSQHFKSVVQVHCGNIAKSAVDALSEELKLYNISEQDMSFECQESAPVTKLAKQVAASPGAAIVLWLGKNHVAQLGKVLPTARAYMSSTLLKTEQAIKLPSLPISTYLVHPYKLPGKMDSAYIRFKVWAMRQKIAIQFPRQQSEAFFACLVANDAVSHLGRFLVRDYVLDMLDHSQPMTGYLPFYPKPTIGPGQRFLTKGGYIVTALNGKLATRDAVWITP